MTPIHRFVRVVLAVAIIGSVALLHARPGDRLLSPEQAEIARTMIEARRCACGCGNYLPGSPKEPSCFGCSVGKWEVSFIVEGLAAGRTQGDIVLDLTQDLIINVFADYGDPELPEVWERVRRVAAASDVKRVVLRPVGWTANGLNAVRLVEYAREAGRFGAMNERLIEWDGYWDERSLSRIATELGLSADDAIAFMHEADIMSQISRNREHAQHAGIETYPALTIGHERIGLDEESLRRALHAALLDDSM